jgi:cytochrome P450
MPAEHHSALDAPNQDSFAPDLDAWVLRSYARVSAALDSPSLLAIGEPAGNSARQAAVAVRTAARASFRAAHLAEWRAALLASARRAAERVITRRPVDVVAGFARPWSTELALLVARMDPARADDLFDLARTVFLDAARSTDGTTSSGAQVAATALAAELSGTAGPKTAPPTIDVQSFVALSQTLPCLLASVWHALFTHPDQLERLRSSGDCASSIDELLRFAGPSRAVFRRAGPKGSAPVRGDVRIAPGQRVILMLHAANRDPARFPDPNRLDLARDASGHVAFGRGSHSCVGAPVVRLAVEIATNALLEASEGYVGVTDVQWLDGFAIRAPVRLTAVLTPASAP